MKNKLVRKLAKGGKQLNLKFECGSTSGDRPTQGAFNLINLDSYSLIMAAPEEEQCKTHSATKGFKVINLTQNSFSPNTNSK